MEAPFHVNDLLRCGAKFTSAKDLKNAVIKLGEKYRITKIKDKTNTPLS